jgi:hypothetical protein
MNKILGMVIFCTTIVSCQVSKEQMLGKDFRLYKDTPAWEFAKSVEKQDTADFKSIIDKSKVNVDVEEDKYGRTLLQIAVLNNLDKSVKKLLELGADPNHNNKNNGYSAMHDAVGVFQHNDDTLILSLLLKYGGDPNSKTALTEANTGAYSKNVISILCGNVEDQYNKLKLLIKSGASLEYDGEDNSNFMYSALKSKNYKQIFMLLNLGVDYSKPIFTTFSGEKVFIQVYMKYYLIDLESEEYQYKLKVIDFLEKRGVNYRDVIPPKKTIEMAKRQYPDSWEEYLKKY